MASPSSSKTAIMIASFALLVVPLALWTTSKCHRAKRRIQQDNEDNEEQGLMSPAHLTPDRKTNNKIASVIAKFETKTPIIQQEKEESVSLITRRYSSQKKKNVARKIASFERPTSLTKEYCAVCQQRIFPTQPKITARQTLFHTSCFKCSTCNAKLCNFPEERHVPMGPTIFLHCKQCQLDSQQTYKSKRLSTVAGTKTLVGETEQGDICQIHETIGDDLERALIGMIPRCATCGGDFLSASTDISILGPLKYHKECFTMGRPSVTPQHTLTTIQSAKYLPETIILRIHCTNRNSDGNRKRKVLTSLYFCWNNKEEELKSLCQQWPRKALPDCITVQFPLEVKAGGTTKRNISIGGDNHEFGVDVVGFPLVPPNTIQTVVELPHISSSKSFFCAKLEFQKYNLWHSLRLEVPSLPDQQTLDLTHAALTVEICQGKLATTTP